MNETKLKLKVGKVYLSRGGDVFKVIKKRNRIDYGGYPYPYPYTTEALNFCGQATFTEEGRININRESSFDLVEELDQSPKPLKRFLKEVTQLLCVLAVLTLICIAGTGVESEDGIRQPSLVADLLRRLT